ncbi:PQQ-binding-like beta-propeller repeat protein [Streptomyces sp. NPDC059533]|uniref:protein kinase domain-containing protein n=1 Tax=Streptomyces sp. NPDC059533 TaxID=3346858 RepID=UPI003697B6FA
MGRLLAGRYELDDRPLGSGAHGEVWAAWDPKMQRRVVVKVMRPLPGRGPVVPAVFQEARTAARANHPGIVTVHDVERDTTGDWFLVMELITGQDLSCVLASGEVPSVTTALDWASQVADALRAAHDEGVVHRDLKPSNLMLTRSGRIKILDFGIAGFVDNASADSEPIGSWPYMAPERIDGLRGDARTDLYALGCVLYELLTGRPPFSDLIGIALLDAHRNTPPLSLGTKVPGLHPGLDELVAALLAKNPDGRPSTAAHVRDRLRELAAEPPPPAPAPAPAQAPAQVPSEPPPEVTDPPQLQDVPTQDPPPHKVPPSPTLRVPGPAAPPSPPPAEEPAGALRWFLLGRVLPLVVGVVACVVAVSLLIGYLQDTRKLWFTPIGAQGYFVVSEHTAFLAGPANGVVEARDTASGELKWTYRTGDTTGSAKVEAAAGGSVYVVTGRGVIHVVAADTGKQRWVEPADGTRGGVRALAVAGPSLYAVSDEDVRALDAATGKQRWQVSASGGAAHIEVASGTVYVSCESDEPGVEYAEEHATLFALEADTGNIKWQYRSANPLRSDPAVSGDTVYIGSWDNQLHALDAVSGTSKWAYDAREPIGSTPVVADGVVYATTQYGTVVAVDARTGDEVWRDDAPKYGTGGRAPQVVDGVVYVADGDRKRIRALDARSGAQKWDYPVDATRSLSDPAVVGGVLYVGTTANVYLTAGDPRRHTFVALSTRP